MVAIHTCRGQGSERARRLSGTAFSPMLVGAGGRKKGMEETGIDTGEARRESSHVAAEGGWKEPVIQGSLEKSGQENDHMRQRQ